MPIKCLLSPLEKKFQVFFYKSSSRLNDASKPEYYLSVVLRWLTDNRLFLREIEEFFLEYSASFEFSAAVVKLAAAKVRSEIGNNLEDEIFSHLIDEILSSDNDLLEFEPKLAEVERPLSVLENEPTVIQRWLNLELLAAKER